MACSRRDRQVADRCVFRFTRTVGASQGSDAGVRLGFRFLGAMLVGDIPISFIQGREDAEKTTGTVSQCYLSHRDAG